MFEGDNWSVLMSHISETISHPNNVNDNVVKYNLTNNDNVRASNKTSEEVDAIANKLVEALNNPISREFYCMVGWKLSEAEIYGNLEKAKRGRSPQRYFTWLCQQSLDKLK